MMLGNPVPKIERDDGDASHPAHYDERYHEPIMNPRCPFYHAWRSTMLMAL